MHGSLPTHWKFPHKLKAGYPLGEVLKFKLKPYIVTYIGK